MANPKLTRNWTVNAENTSGPAGARDGDIDILVDSTANHAPIPPTRPSRNVSRKEVGQLAESKFSQSIRNDTNAYAGQTEQIQRRWQYLIVTV